MKEDRIALFRGFAFLGLLIPIAILFHLITFPFYLVIRTVVTVWQPYFYKRSRDKLTKHWIDELENGVDIDYPPRVGTLFGIPPWGYKGELD